MTNARRILLTAVLVGIGLGAALILTGCDDEAVADATAARGVGTAAATTPVAVEASQPQEAPQETPAPIAGSTGGELSILALSVDELIQNTSQYTGREVAVRGTILTQCIRGCQFSLDDGTGVVGIELVEEALENVLMTGSVGRIVEVRGVVEGSSRPLILVKDRDGWSYAD